MSTPRLLQFHSSRAAVVWAQGRGGWWESEFMDGRLAHSVDFLLVLFLLNQHFGLRDGHLHGFGFRQWAQWCVYQGLLCCTWTDDTLRMSMQVCHHGDRQSDRHIEESVAVLPSVPSPFPCPHTTLRCWNPHAAALRVRFCLRVLILSRRRVHTAFCY